MATKTIFVISAYAWEYNDNYHYQPDNDPADPQKAFSDRVMADQECAMLNCNSMKGLDIGDYTSEDLRSCLVDGEDSWTSFLEWANKALGTNWKDKDRQFLVPAGSSDEARAELLTKINLRWYVVQEIEFDDSGSKPTPKPTVQRDPDEDLPGNRRIFLED